MPRRRNRERSQLDGDLLPDWYDDWLMIERERLRQLRVHALEQLAERAMREGRYGHAIDPPSRRSRPIRCARAPTAC